MEEKRGKSRLVSALLLVTGNILILMLVGGDRRWMPAAIESFATTQPSLALFVLSFVMTFTGLIFSYATRLPRGGVVLINSTLFIAFGLIATSAPNATATLPDLLRPMLIGTGAAWILYLSLKGFRTVLTRLI